MAQHEIIKLFENLQIRTVWDDKDEKYFFSVIDIIKVLTGSENPRRYWSDLKRKLSAEGSQLYENIVQLKLSSSDGKKYLTDVADVEQVMRIIQSIPSKKAEPFKQWLAQNAYVAKDGAEVARNARADIEHRLVHSVISQQKAIDHIKPLDELPLGGNTPPEQHRTRQNNEEKTS